MCILFNNYCRVQLLKYPQCYDKIKRVNPFGKFIKTQIECRDAKH